MDTDKLAALVEDLIVVLHRQAREVEKLVEKLVAHPLVVLSPFR
jgi:hypothetical protein